jgi:hypothetical protein
LVLLRSLYPSMPCVAGYPLCFVIKLTEGFGYWNGPSYSIPFLHQINFWHHSDKYCKSTGPALKHSLYTTTVSSSARLIISLGASHNHVPTRLVKFAYSLDGAAPVNVRPVSTAPPYKEGQAWQRAVIANAWTSWSSSRVWLILERMSCHSSFLSLALPCRKLCWTWGGYNDLALGPPERRKVDK